MGLPPTDMVCNISLAAGEREESAFLLHPKNAAVTGAFSYTGRYVAKRLLDAGRQQSGP